jgi:hypothetical protein
MPPSIARRHSGVTSVDESSRRAAITDVINAGAAAKTKHTGTPSHLVRAYRMARNLRNVLRVAAGEVRIYRRQQAHFSVSDSQPTANRNDRVITKIAPESRRRRRIRKRDPAVTS